MAKKPVLGQDVSAAKQPDPGNIPAQKLVVFSFKYFREIDHFGLGQQGAGWFHSLFVRLTELSREKLSELNTDAGKRRAWRFHPINWNQPNIPIRRSDLTWIDKEILDNEDEFPLHQFQITTALGRVVGFFDSQSVFNVVLFDPLHNIQPSKHFDYRVRETVITEAIAARLFKFVEDRLSVCPVADCLCRTEFAEFQRAAIKNTQGHSIIVGLEDQTFVRVTNCINNGYANSISELIEVALGELGI